MGLTLCFSRISQLEASGGDAAQYQHWNEKIEAARLVLITLAVEAHRKDPLGGGWEPAPGEGLIAESFQENPETPPVHIRRITLEEVKPSPVA